MAKLRHKTSLLVFKKNKDSGLQGLQIQWGVEMELIEISFSLLSEKREFLYTTRVDQLL